jgi:hypothetical protein
MQFEKQASLEIESTKMQNVVSINAQRSTQQGSSNEYKPLVLWRTRAPKREASMMIFV